MAKIKISKADIDRIIKEEAQKFKKVISLKKQLSEIQSELKTLNEVSAGGEMPATDKNGSGVHAGQKRPVFHRPKRNPNTLMEDPAEDEITDDVIDSTDEMGGDLENAGESDSVAKQDILNAIEDMKMALNLIGDSSIDTEEAGEDLEGTEGEMGEEIPGESDGEEMVADEAPIEGAEEEPTEELYEFEENSDNPIVNEIEGISVANQTQENKVDKLYHKVDVKESVSPKNTLLESERKRMMELSGIVLKS
jgi:hypothetical protein